MLLNHKKKNYDIIFTKKMTPKKNDQPKSEKIINYPSETASNYF